ncbi:hypothetical protein FHR66_001171 [Xanthomonas sp. F4]
MTSPCTRPVTVLLSALALGMAAGNSAAAASAADDPLFRYQWYLHNQGQAVIGDTLPTAGVDLDVDVLHELHIRGAGAKIGVIDGGWTSATKTLPPTSCPTARTISSTVRTTPSRATSTTRTARRWPASPPR